MISWVCNCTHANLQIPLRGDLDQLAGGRAIMKTLDGDRERKTRVEADKWGEEGSRVSQWDSDPSTITVQMWNKFLWKSALINWKCVTIGTIYYDIFKVVSITTFGGRETQRQKSQRQQMQHLGLVSWGLWVCRRGSQLVRNKIANKAERGPRIIRKLTLLTSVIISAILKLTGAQLFRSVSYYYEKIPKLISLLNYVYSWNNRKRQIWIFSRGSPGNVETQKCILNFKHIFKNFQMSIDSKDNHWSVSARPSISLCILAYRLLLYLEVSRGPWD